MVTHSPPLHHLSNPPFKTQISLLGLRTQQPFVLSTMNSHEPLHPFLKKKKKASSQSYVWLYTWIFRRQFDSMSIWQNESNRCAPSGLWLNHEPLTRCTALGVSFLPWSGPQIQSASVWLWLWRSCHYCTSVHVWPGRKSSRLREGVDDVSLPVAWVAHSSLGKPGRRQRGSFYFSCSLTSLCLLTKLCGVFSNKISPLSAGDQPRPKAIARVLGVFRVFLTNNS